MDEKDLQAIAQLIAQQKQEIVQEMDSKLAQQKQEMVQAMARQKHEIINEVKVLIEAYITPKFNLLADGILSINEKLILREAS